jgi:hypothetical protein
VGKLDDPDLANSALHLHLCDAENAVVALAPVSGIDANITKVFETKSFNELNGHGKLGCSRVNQRLALNFLAPSIHRQEAVLPISHFNWNAKYTHASFIADSASRR